MALDMFLELERALRLSLPAAGDKPLRKIGISITLRFMRTTDRNLFLRKAV
jgi:hypothetical protein